jgi:hypothetical protein
MLRVAGIGAPPEARGEQNRGPRDQTEPPPRGSNRQEIEASRDAAMQRQLDYERQRALQADEVQREIEERRLSEQWQRERNAPPPPA